MVRKIAGFAVALMCVGAVVVGTPQAAAAQEAENPDDKISDFVDDTIGQGVFFITPEIELPADYDAGIVGGTGGGDAGAGLAATGVDVEPVAALGIGLVAVGGSMLVGARRRLAKPS